MYPDATLQTIISAALENDVDAYAFACDALAEWLDSGGCCPTVPDGTLSIPGTNTRWSLLSPFADVPFWRLVYWSHDGSVIKTYRLS